MESAKESIAKVMERINTPRLEKQSETIEKEFNCLMCKKSFKLAINSDCVPQSIFEILKRPGELSNYATGFVSRNFGFEKFNLCSDACNELYKRDLEEKKVMAIKTEREITINRILPKKFIDIDSDNRNIENLVGKSLFIHGLSGVGKSVLMATLVKRYIRDGKRVDWIQYPRFIMKLQGMFGDYRPEYSDQGYKIEKRNPYEWAIEIGEYDGILAIDDLGVEKASEFVRQITYSIINEREVNQRQTLITSNYGLRDIDRMIDSRISSRIAGMCEIVELKGKDRRLSK